MQPKRGRGRPRREGADEEILAATLAVLREAGYADLTVDVVAERAGVAKTTIYRRWPSKGTLVAAAVAPMAAAEAPPDFGSLEDDATALLDRMRTLLRGELGPIAAAVIGEAQRDPELVEVIRMVIAPRRQMFRDAIRRGIARGEVRADADVDLTVDLLSGPIWSRLLVSHDPMPDELPRAIARSIVDGLRPR